MVVRIAAVAVWMAVAVGYLGEVSMSVSKPRYLVGSLIV